MERAKTTLFFLGVTPRIEETAGNERYALHSMQPVSI
jgi:hypothetical protein